MRLVGLASIAGAAIALSSCQAANTKKAEKPQTSAVAGDSIDAEMAKKMVEAKAAYEKLSPAEKDKLAKRSKAASSTLPLTLAKAALLPVTVASGATTLGTLAPAGKPTIIAAWASWCVPCKVEARQLADLRRQHGADALNIVYLNIGNPEVEAKKAPRFLKDAGAEPLGLNMFSMEAFRKLTKLDQVSIPRVLPYDRNGQPRAPISGLHIPASGIEQAIDPQLAKAVKAIL
jgi:thiol-disulfide isomerase/thioredoxin